MPTFFQDIDQRRVGTGPIVYDEDEFPASFPFAIWALQIDRYLRYWNAFTGAWLTEMLPDDIDEKSQPVLRYPLQINYIKTGCMKHSYILFGEVPDGPGPLAPIRITPRIKPGKDAVDDAARRRAKELEDLVNRVWMDNNGRGLQQEAGLCQQFLGGIVFRVGWQPQDFDLEFGIRLEMVLPDFFLPVWDTGKPDDLLEAWIVYRVPTREARIRFGFDLTEGAIDPLFIEHWTKKEVTILLGGKPLVYKVAGETITYDHIPNVFGFVPFFYIPRERAGSYYGLSLIDDVVELAKEMNARLADISDVIEETSHRDVFMRNVNISPKTTDIGSSRPAINIGQTPPGGDVPDAFAIDPPVINEALTKHPEYLREQFGRDIFAPGVTDGEDEGSQRSALTLAFRMHPITSKTRACRTFWTTGLIIAGKRIAQIAIMKGVGGLTPQHLEDIDWSVAWAPMIPRDREVELNEAVLGIQTHMLTPEEGNELLNLTEDPAASRAQVEEWMEWENKLQIDMAAEQMQQKVNIRTKTQQVSTVIKEPGEQ